MQKEHCTGKRKQVGKNTRVEEGRGQFLELRKGRWRKNISLKCHTDRISLGAEMSQGYSMVYRAWLGLPNTFRLSSVLWEKSAEIFISFILNLVIQEPKQSEVTDLDIFLCLFCSHHLPGPYGLCCSGRSEVGAELTKRPKWRDGQSAPPVQFQALVFVMGWCKLSQVGKVDRHFRACLLLNPVLVDLAALQRSMIVMETFSSSSGVTRDPTPWPAVGSPWQTHA